MYAPILFIFYDMILIRTFHNHSQENSGFGDAEFGGVQP
jgi:hypothetical protein